MDFAQTLHSRRSVRSYRQEPIAEPVLRALVDAAIQAPSAVNEQPWLFSIVRSKSLLEKISAKAKAHLMETRMGDAAADRFRAMLGDPGFNIFYDAPVLIVISSATSGGWAVENCALAAENLMLAAYAAGLGACWIGFAQHWLASDEGKAALRLPSGCQPVAPIIVGHPQSQPPPVPRKEPEIFWLDD
ncbi:nitroreductase family protein [Phenylobacterium montanum]|uniref:Nitroreductase family protein n=1 Tax=Phenylobacterium montanum TaxID=2823693 RepID=A0A975G1D2_9CAUL|nr:nitroreductase family protein [Caulobacter sp. S6]QUD89323.1 nitroreductase family protein [Caulobacter sp. S6]